ncbi:MAG TPA: C45 family peptidase [Actinomycetota bacterium]
MIPVVRVSGGPEERGRAVGEALAEPIHRSLAFYRGYLQRRGISRESFPLVLRPHRRAAEQGLPELVAEIDAMAEGAGADPWDLFAVNAFEELEPAMSEPSMERCTSFSASTPGGPILAHNEQWLAGDLGNVAVVVADPTEGPGFASPTVVACLPAVGMNTAGLAQAIMSLSAGDDREGVPRVLVSRHALQARFSDDAVKRADLPGRAGGYAHMFAGGGGAAFTIETTAERVAVLDGHGPHTNHYIHQDLTLIGDPPRAGSLSRLERARELLEDRPPQSPEDAMAILADHEGHPQPICLHADPKDGDDAEAVVFSMVCSLHDRRMWVAPGPPCSTPFEEIEVA